MQRKIKPTNSCTKPLSVSRADLPSSSHYSLGEKAVGVSTVSPSKVTRNHPESQVKSNIRTDSNTKYKRPVKSSKTGSNFKGGLSHKNTLEAYFKVGTKQSAQLSTTDQGKFVKFGGEKVHKKLKQTKIIFNQLSGAIMGSGQNDLNDGEISLARLPGPDIQSIVELDPDPAGYFTKVDKDSKL